MILNLVFSDKDMAGSIGKYLECTLRPHKMNYILFEQSKIFSSEILKADLWMLEAIHSYNNPEGFQLSMTLAGKSRILILFSVTKPSTIPDEGDFWTVFHSDIPLADKIKDTLVKPPPSSDDLQSLIKLWPMLGYKRTTHHSYKKIGE